jgi:hypothetical protein
MLENPHLFVAADLESKALMKQMFTEAFTTVVTRVFGWGLPFTIMVPFADFINHHNVDSGYELVLRDGDPRQISTQVHQSYFTESKAAVNYGQFFKGEYKQANSCKNRLALQAKRKELQGAKLDKLAEYQSSSDSEDNDSVSEEDEDGGNSLVKHEKLVDELLPPDLLERDLFFRL